MSIAEKRKMSAKERYDKENTTFVGLKLNNKTDSDILSAIENKPKQTEIKRLVRKGIESEKKEWDELQTTNQTNSSQSRQEYYLSNSIIT